MAEKLSKEEVDYSPGMGQRRCYLCEHFIPRDSCEIVEGRIKQDYWCRKFSRNK